VKTLGYGIALSALLFGCGDNIDGGKTVCEEQSGHACTWAGVPGVFGFNGDGLDRRATELYWTMDMLFATDGTIWFIDWNNHLVRRIDDDIVTTVVGWVDPIFPGDGLSGPAERMPAGVVGTDVKLNHPTDLVETDDGKILVMAWHNHKLREIDPSNNHVRIVAGGGAGFAGDGMLVTDVAPLSLFKQPKSLVRAPNGDLYILDQQNFRIRKIEKATGMLTTIAGNGMQGFDGDGGPALAAKLNFEAGSNPEPSGGLALKGNTLFIADTLSNRIRAMNLDTGTIDTIAGTGEEGFSGDGGPALSARLAHPRDMEIGPEGDLYVADTDNNRIRAISLDSATSNIRTVAGSGVLGLDENDGMLATEMKLARPFGIEFSPAGDLYISDTINSRIVKVTK
jgi:DNA-binding beta-propeller fold protein YncE